MPKIEQLLAVAAAGKDNNMGRGAALAAGWSLPSNNNAWTGEVDYNGSNFMEASVVNLNTSDVSTSKVNDESTTTVCLK